MKKFLLTAAIAALVGLTCDAASVKVRGVVRDDKGKPVSGVKVTDGYDIVRTGADGSYTIETHDDAQFVYLTVPAGFEVASRNGAPMFYKMVQPGAGSQRIDFDLIRTGRDETRHQFMVWADVQVYREGEIALVKEAAADARELVAQGGTPAFGLSCGDIVGEWNSGMFEKIHKATAECGVPFYTLMGNHDYQTGTATNEESKQIYKDKFGPTYYSFDKGRMHYVVLDDVFYYYRHYMGYIEDAQLKWLQKDLEGLKEGSTLVIFMHIPTYSREARRGEWNKEEYNKIVTNRKALYKILKPYNTHICSAHEHYAENYIIEDNLMEHVHAPLSGLFWQSLYSCDGVPWGYYVYEVDGQDLKWYYKPVGKSRDTQFSAYRVGDDPMKSDCIVANVWNYDPAWKVEWSENGVPQGEMTRYSGWDRNIVDDVDNRRDKEFTWKYIGAGQTEHLFYATPASVDSDVEIVVTDRFGRQYRWSNTDRVIYSNDSYTLTSEKVLEGGKEYGVKSQCQYPQYGVFKGADKMESDLYDLAVAEMVKDIESGRTFRTGELWSGVWTRDVSYSAILSLAHLEPEVVKNSLLRKVDRKKRIIEDTGTGGSWPCSTDRVIWAIAAYEVYLETGDVAFLKQIYPIVKKTIDIDIATVYNPQSGLFRGESSFIDWRDQSYPAWMQPADIAASECLGTNAVYYRALQVISQMASKIGGTRAMDARYYSDLAVKLRKAINDRFWLQYDGYYAQYWYGRNYRILSPRSETLGESLCVLWDIASPSQAASIMERMPIGYFGPSIFAPQISAVGSYHNNAVWPFVTSFYGMAAAKTGNTEAVLNAVASNSRAATVFGSNQENMVASDGSLHTALNSPRQLWSVAGYIGLVRNALLGINYSEDGIRFKPCVPKSMKALRRIEDMKYRKMTLDIEVIGSGAIIKSFRLDGQESADAFVPASLEGHHSVKIVMTSDYYAPEDKVNLAPLRWDLDIPDVRYADGTLHWTAVKDADFYEVFCNGEKLTEVTGTSVPASRIGEYYVIAGNGSGRYSFASEPLRVRMSEKRYPAGQTLDNKLGTQFKMEFEVDSDGLYSIDFEYSNGNGDITTHNKCATRTLFVDRNMTGPVVMPQRGDSWDAKGFTQPSMVELKAGKHSLELRYLEENVNMNIDVDGAIIRTVRISKLEK